MFGVVECLLFYFCLSWFESDLFCLAIRLAMGGLGSLGVGFLFCGCGGLFGVVMCFV